MYVSGVERLRNGQKLTPGSLPHPLRIEHSHMSVLASSHTVNDFCWLCPSGPRLCNDSPGDACFRSNDLSTTPFTLLSSPHRL
jgi:hypothetical protein